ncbi:MAG: RNA polymerase sigma factor, partial [Planctomycetes bacterium]|nr:RNA polymerase sigma factor [Planctomycetota bacterium]
MHEGSRSIAIDDLLAQSGWVTALVRGIVKDADLADDIVQETWLRAIRSRPKAAYGTPSVRLWLATVARRVAMRWASSDSARRRREQAVAVDEAVDPEVYTERIRLQREVATHVLALDELHRQAVVMRYQDGLAPKE